MASLVKPAFPEVTLVLLVNGDTTGGGELIAAAIQDHKRGTIVGERTFGKASIQRALNPNPIGIPFKLTTGTFKRPNGKNLQRFPDSKPDDDWGIRPDAGMDFPHSPEMSIQLKAWWQQHVLRPAQSREALPLDDPDADPQLKAALDVLREMVKK